MENDKRVRTTITLDHSTRELAKKFAKDSSRSLSGFIESLVKRYVENQEKESSFGETTTKQKQIQ